MKGIPGLIIAATLAVAGGICNWLYIAKQADRYERESFVKVKVDQIRAGDRFKKDDFDKIDIPKNNLGNLEKIAVRWQDLSTVLNQVAVKDFTRDQLILQDDLRTPPSRALNQMLAPNERIIFLPVDPRSFNPQHVNPGDMVSFRIPASLGIAASPTAAVGVENTDLTTENQQRRAEIIGPFRILALGNRKGTIDTARVIGQRSGSENDIAVSVEIRGNDVEPNAQTILDVVSRTNFKGVQVLLHPASDNK
ncbi:MAG: hypothetical protein HQ518_03340 [Rhodopirellula sp.]|nr:hypothetical protein [Rhodopirellula sp.]